MEKNIKIEKGIKRPSTNKALFIKSVKESIRELILVLSGKIKGRNAEELFDEL